MSKFILQFVGSKIFIIHVFLNVSAFPDLGHVLSLTWDTWLPRHVSQCLQLWLEKVELDISKVSSL